MKRSKLALAAGVCGAVGLFDPALGAALAHLGVLAPLSGFILFGLGLFTALVAALLGAGALYTTRASAGRSGRGLAWLGVVAGVAMFSVAAVARSPGADVPAINDISTDLADPPAFPSDPSGRSRDMAYPAGNADLIKATPAYADLKPRPIAQPPSEVFARVESTARGLGWQVVQADASAGILVANDSTSVFRFVDDIVVRVRGDGTGGAIVDMRSKSRDGRGDVGANAARIRRFFAALGS
jgi:uncharacterized protein (DUF1499 family)